MRRALNFTSPAPRERSACESAPGEGARLLLTTDAVGGVWRYTMELAAGLRALGAAVRVVSLGPQPSPAQRAEAGSSLHVTDLALDWLARQPAELEHAARELAAIARAWGASGIHLHLPALAALAHWPAPVVAVAHSCVGTWWHAVRGGALPADLAWRAALVRQGLVAADTVLAPSASFAELVAETYDLQRPVRAMPNGRKPLPIPELPRGSVLTVGRLWDESKNIAMLDRAAAHGKLAIRAAGPVRAPNGAATSPRHLRLLGALDEPALAREYAAAAVFVSVARYEPFGLAVLEAAQSGCALVLSDIPTFRELWDGAAFFVDPDNFAGIAAAIGAARTQAAFLSAASRARARRYTREAMAGATLEMHSLREAA